jgi:hypothetical protein
MNKRAAINFFFLLSIIFKCSGQSTSQSSDQKWDNLKNQFVNSTKNVSDGASGFLKGMGQSVGIVTADYHYSYQVWNDTPVFLLVGQQRVVPAMGVNIPEDFYNAQMLRGFTNTGSNFLNQQLYLRVVLFADPANKNFNPYFTSPVSDLEKLAPQSGQFQILNKEIYPWAKDDDNIYFYRAYSSKSQIKAEYLGIKTATTDFLASFYNSSSKDVQLHFAKDGIKYDVTLESLTFNTLQSLAGSGTSIRPSGNEKRFFDFKLAGKTIDQIPILSEGIGNVAYNDATKKYDPAGPMLYTYEIYDAQPTPKATMQGLSIGNFTQPTSGLIRDINPVPCLVWYQSAAQLQKMQASAAKDTEQDSVYFDAPESFWVAYQTADWSIQKKVDPGTVGKFTIVRPRLSEKQAVLYGVSLQTNDEKKARQFLNRLTTGKLVTPTAYDQSGLAGERIDLSVIKPSTNGIIVDNDPKDPARTGLTGYLLFSDVFFPTGVDSNAVFYYLVPAPQLKIDQLVNALYLDDNSYTKDESGAVVLKKEVFGELSGLIKNWIVAYKKDSLGVAAQVKNYLMSHGNKEVFVDPAASNQSRALTTQGQRMLEMFLTGPISLKNAPLLRSAGTNYYVYGLGSKPDSWPS